MWLKGFTNSKSVFLSNKKYFIFLFFYSFLLLLLCSTFSPLHGFNYWPDVNVYYTIGKGLFFDKIPYKDLFDHKGPIIFFIYAIGYYFSPNSFTGMFFIQTIFLTISLYYVFRISNIFVNSCLSLVCSCFFPLFLFSFNAMGGSAEEFVLAFLFISFFLFISYFKASSVYHPPLNMFIHGIIFSIVFFIKLNLIIFWFVPLFTIFLILLVNKSYDNLLKNSVYFIFGILSIFLLIFLYFSYSKGLTDFLEGYFHMNAIYGKYPNASISEYFLAVFSRIIIVFRGLYISSFLVVFGVFYFTFSKSLSKKIARITLFIWFICILLVLFTSQAVMLYYYIIYCVFIPLGIISIFLIFKLRFYPRSNHQRVYAFLLLIALFIFTAYTKTDLKTVFTEKNDENSIYSVFAQEISKRSEVDKTLLCLGLDYSINVFTKAKIVPNVQYFFTPNIGPDLYPIIYESQLSYIRNRKINYILMNDSYRYKDIFIQAIDSAEYYKIKKYNGFTLYCL